MIDPERALDTLEWWLPLIDGQAIQPASIWTVPRTTSGRTRRSVPLSIGPDGVACGGKPGAWVSNKQISDGGRYVRLIESRLEGIGLACESLRRLETLCAGSDDQRKAAVVLMVAYLLTGRDRRLEWGAKGGLGLWVAYVCADPAARRDWLTAGTETFGRTRALTWGRTLLSDAVDAWHRLPADAGRPVHGRGRLRVSEVRDVLSRAMATAQRDLRDVSAVRREVRVQQRRVAAAATAKQLN